MLLVAPVKKDKWLDMSDDQQALFGIERLNIARSTIPAVTHVDYSARIQTVHKETNSRFYQLIDQFEQKTQCPVLINTSFNVRGEPIVNTPEDAYRCFMRTEMDYLVMENIILAKSDQPLADQNDTWKEEFELD
jgi:carbamoyltransferase